jgi:hypothetical protein
MPGNYAVRHRDNELIREVQKNQREILYLRQRLTQAQLGFNSSDQLLTDTDVNDESSDITITKLA